VESIMPSSPLSVLLPADLRARLADEARRRHLKLSSVVRVLAAERVAQIDASEELSAAQEWQRDQAWAAWDALRGGDRREATRADIDRDFDRAAARAARRQR
jgi:hypothetical protein